MRLLKSGGKAHKFGQPMLVNLLRNIFCLIEIDFPFLSEIFLCGSMYMFYIK